jgi:hypothetical protein
MVALAPATGPIEVTLLSATFPTAAAAASYDGGGTLGMPALLPPGVSGWISYGTSCSFISHETSFARGIRQEPRSSSRSIL